MLNPIKPKGGIGKKPENSLQEIRSRSDGDSVRPCVGVSKLLRLASENFRCCVHCSN